MPKTPTKTPPKNPQIQILGPDWMTGREAMNELQIAERTLREWAQDGRIRTRAIHIPGQRPQRVYSAADVATIRSQGLPTEPRAVRRAIAAAVAGRPIAPSTIAAPAAQKQLAAAAEAIKAPKVEVTEKLWLTLEEASAYSGHSITALRAMIDANELEGKHAGRGGAIIVRRRQLLELLG